MATLAATRRRVGNLSYILLHGFTKTQNVDTFKLTQSRLTCHHEDDNSCQYQESGTRLLAHQQLASLRSSFLPPVRTSGRHMQNSKELNHYSPINNIPTNHSANILHKIAAEVVLSGLNDVPIGKQLRLKCEFEAANQKLKAGELPWSTLAIILNEQDPPPHIIGDVEQHRRGARLTRRIIGLNESDCSQTLVRGMTQFNERSALVNTEVRQNSINHIS